MYIHDCIGLATGEEHLSHMCEHKGTAKETASSIAIATYVAHEDDPTIRCDIKNLILAMHSMLHLPRRWVQRLTTNIYLYQLILTSARWDVIAPPAISLTSQRADTSHLVARIAGKSCNSAKWKGRAWKKTAMGRRSRITAEDNWYCEHTTTNDNQISWVYLTTTWGEHDAEATQIGFWQK